MLRGLHTVGILATTVAAWLVVASLSQRMALFYVMLAAVSVLTLLRLRNRRVLRPGLAFLAIALGIAVSPVDFLVQSTGRRELVMLPASFGDACDPSATACYGCIVGRNPPRYALVLSL
jgi:hypothetical protein